VNDLEDLMHSYGLDSSNPDHLDELIFRVTNENTTSIYDPDDIEATLSKYTDINDYYEEYQDNED
jgi:hypothetical protein